MKRIEAFLNSGLYIGLIFLLTFISWMQYEDTPPYDFNLYLMIGVFFLILVNTLILVFFRNTMYTVPILISFLFIINKSDMTFDTVSALGFPILAFFIFLIGYVIHILRFKPAFKRGQFFFGLMLFAIGYLFPILYIPFDLRSIPVSLMATLYLALYVLMSSTMKSSMDYLFKVMVAVNLLLTFQVFFYSFQGSLIHPDLSFIESLMKGWGRNLGWANVNDMCFYISLTLPGYLYFIFKKPKSLLFWLLMILPTFAVIMTKSRGGMIGYLVAILGIVIFVIAYGNQLMFKKAVIGIIVYILISLALSEIYIIWYEELILSLGNNLNEFSSGRLYIYGNAWKVFLKYPWFGGGWLSIFSFPFDGRLFMYHSTVFHTLATMGLFGVFALAVHYMQIMKFIFRRHKHETYLFLIGYLASQVHGLIDNVQFAVPYSVLIALILAMFETSRKTTSFEEIDERYHLIPSDLYPSMSD